MDPVVARQIAVARCMPDARRARPERRDSRDNHIQTAPAEYITGHHASQGSLAMTALGLVMGPAVFVLGQLLLVIGLVRSALELRRH
jgi:hypothetical protein